MPKASALLPIVSEILFREWEPIGHATANCAATSRGATSPGLVHALLPGADEHKLALWLRRVQSDSIGMSVIDEELHRRVTHRLLGLLADAEPGAAAELARRGGPAASGRSSAPEG